jgi:hypothetical protein
MNYDLGIDLAEGKPIDEAIAGFDKFELVPEGTYRARVVSGEVIEKPFANGHNGKVVKLQLEITEGDHKGRKIFEDVTFYHSGYPNAGQMGRENLLVLIAAVGGKSTNSVAEAIGKEVVFDVRHGEYNNKTYANVVLKSWRPVEKPKNPISETPASAVAAQPIPATDADKPAWMVEL